jgi:uncharacterized protein (TIGR02246 family)
MVIDISDFFSEHFMMVGLTRLAIALLFLEVMVSPIRADEQPDSAVELIQSVSQGMVDAFNTKDASKVVSFFLEDAELIDEDGTIHQGRQEISTLLTLFFEAYPETQMALEIESIRKVGPLMIEDGTRLLVNRQPDNSEEITAAIRYTAVVVKTDQGWKLASLRDFHDVLPVTPGEMLQSLEWLVGSWVNEGTDGRVKITYQWSEDKNFILGDFVVLREGEVAAKSSQRIAWDPILAKPRSWLFDSDGGFSEALWTSVDEGWMIQSSAVLPDGESGSAILKINALDDSRFILKGSNRLVGNFLEDDYELTVVRRPPVAARENAESK